MLNIYSCCDAQLSYFIYFTGIDRSFHQQVVHGEVELETCRCRECILSLIPETADCTVPDVSFDLTDRGVIIPNVHVGRDYSTYHQ